MALNKREADLINDDVKAAAFKLSKADWTDLYFDLFRQVFGENCPECEVMEDAHRRLQIIKTYREARGLTPVAADAGTRG